MTVARAEPQHGPAAKTERDPAATVHAQGDGTKVRPGEKRPPEAKLGEDEREASRGAGETRKTAVETAPRERKEPPTTVEETHPVPAGDRVPGAETHDETSGPASAHARPTHPRDAQKAPAHTVEVEEKPGPAEIAVKKRDEGLVRDFRRHAPKNDPTHTREREKEPPGRRGKKE